MKDWKIVLSAFIFFFLMFFRCTTFDPTLLGWISNGLTLVFLLINISALKEIFNPNYKWINIFSVLWSLIIVYSAYQNQNISYDVPTWNSVTQSVDFYSRKAARYDHSYYFVIKMLMSIFYFEYLNKNGKVLVFIKYLLYFLFPFVIVSDVNGFLYHTEGISGYLAGTKFYVCYLNIFLVTVYSLYCSELKGKSIKVIKLILLITFLLSIKTKCSTMIIGSIIYYYLLFGVPVIKRNVFYKAKTFLIGLLVCDILFFFFVTLLLQIPFIQYIVVDILGEDLTLTGRTIMYAALGGVLSDCPLYGFGIGNAGLVTTMYLVGDNAQNGLLNLFLEIGILGVVCYLIHLLLIIKKSRSNKNSYSIICFVYMMLFLSSVEITFTTYFFSISILLLLQTNSFSVKRKQYLNIYEDCRNNNCT